MSDLRGRVKKLEGQIVSDACPLPGLVRICFSEEDERQAEEELKTHPEGTMLVVVRSIDFRREVSVCH